MDSLLQPWTQPCCHNEGSLLFEQNVDTTRQCKLLIYLCQMGGEKKVLIVICLNRQASKVQISLPGRKKCAAKKEAKKTSSSSVPEKNQDNLKRYYFFFKFFILFCFPCLKSAAWSPLDIFTFKLPLCCSSSVSSEEPSLEREKPETGENKEEEETLKESAATAEELVALAAAPPPAVQEVPPHLRKQHVRKCHDGCFQIIDFFFLPP